MKLWNLLFYYMYLFWFDLDRKFGLPRLLSFIYKVWYPQKNTQGITFKRFKKNGLNAWAVLKAKLSMDTLVACFIFGVAGMTPGIIGRIMGKIQYILVFGAVLVVFSILINDFFLYKNDKYVNYFNEFNKMNRKQRVIYGLTSFLIILLTYVFSFLSLVFTGAGV